MIDLTASSSPSKHRSAIIKTFAGWTALSALRSGSLVKSRAEIYPLLRLANFDAILEANVCLTPEAYCIR